MHDQVGSTDTGLQPGELALEVVSGHGHSAFAVFFHNRLNLLGDFGERLIPGNFFKLAFPAFTHALHRLAQTQRMIPGPHGTCTSGAAASLGMRGIRHDADSFTGNRSTLLVKSKQTAVPAADVTSTRMCLPAFFF